MSSHNQTDRPYQLVAYAGASASPALGDVKVIDLRWEGPLVLPAPVAPDDAPGADGDEQAVDGAAVTEVEHGVVVSLMSSAISPADVRSRILFLIDAAADTDRVLASYAALTAFCGRRVDAARGGDRVDLAVVELEARNRADAGRVEDQPEMVVVAESATFDPSTIGVDAPVLLLSALTGADLAKLRWARRVVLVPPADTLSAIQAFVLVCALRVRGDQERYPVIATAEGLLDTDDIRRQAADVRRKLRADDNMPLADKVPVPKRYRDMLAAAAVPIEAVMVAMGSTTPGEGLWHCPRPGRHTNGDANASMRVERGKGRCFRCDAERVDAVRLVADVKGWSADEATEWILDDVSPNVARLMAVVADKLPTEEVPAPV